MKRITNVAVLAILSAVASTGCLGQPNEDERAPSSEPSSRREAATDEEQSADATDVPHQTLELKVNINGDSQGTPTAPWFWAGGPHPVPWKENPGTPDPNADPNASNAKKP